jgi:ABC-type phosphate/phosphonate transport system substrate-binding protein
MNTHYKASYYPWITQNVDIKEIHKNIEQLLRLVEEQFFLITAARISIELLPPMDVPKQMESIIKGESQISFMNPLGFIFANLKNTNVKAISVVERKIDDVWGTTYFSQLYTNKRTSIQKDYLKKIKNRSIGFGVAYSTSNFIIPAYELKKAGIDILTNFNKIEFLGGHEVVAKAVYDGKIDIGAGHDGAIIDLSNQYGYGDADDQLIQIHRSSPIPSDPVAVNISDGEFNDMQKALQKASETQDGQNAIAKFWGGARYLLPTETKNYEYLLEAIRNLNLKPEDIIR